MNKLTNFHHIAEQVRHAETAREETIVRAFEALEAQDDSLARLLLQAVGDRQRAARWMGMRQRAFDGRTAYDLLAEGDMDTVWERVAGR